MRFKLHRAWSVLFGVCVFNFIGYGLIVNCFGVFLVPTSQALGISMTQISLTHTLRTICGTLGSMLAGFLIGRVDLRKYLATVSIVLAGSALLTSYVLKLWQLFLCSALTGLSIGMGVYTLVALLLPRWFCRPEGPIGFATACGGLGGIVFSPLLTWLIEQYSWRAGYLFITAAVLLIMLPVAFLLHDSPERCKCSPYGLSNQIQPHEDKDVLMTNGYTLRQAVRMPAFYLIVCFFLAIGIVSGVYSHMPSMLSEKGFSAMQVGALYACYQFGATAAQLAVGLLSMRISVQRSVTLFLLLIACGILGMMLWNGVVPLMALFMFFLGAGRAVGMVAGPFLVRTCFGNIEYSKIFSILYPFYLVSVAVSTTLHGLLHDALGSYYAGYTLMLLCTLLTAFSIHASVFSTKKSEQN